MTRDESWRCKHSVLGYGCGPNCTPTLCQPAFTPCGAPALEGWDKCFLGAGHSDHHESADGTTRWATENLPVPPDGFTSCCHSPNGTHCDGCPASPISLVAQQEGR
jgi:hypothetical protein